MVDKKTNTTINNLSRNLALPQDGISIEIDRVTGKLDVIVLHLPKEVPYDHGGQSNRSTRSEPVDIAHRIIVPAPSFARTPADYLLQHAFLVEVSSGVLNRGSFLSWHP